MHQPSQAEIDGAALRPDAIEGVISGDPQAMAAELHRSRDGRETVFLWTRRACAYEWRFESDETARVLEGEAFVDQGGGERRLGPGDEASFKAGETARWRVPTHLKKLSFCRDARPRPSLVARALRKLGLAPEPA